MNERLAIFSKVTALVTGLTLIIHVLLAGIITCFPEASRGSSILTFYRRFVVLGPFFSESRITSERHLFVQYYADGRWSDSADYGCQRVTDPNTGRYDALLLRSFEEYLAWNLARRRTIDPAAPQFRELDSYLKRRVLPPKADSAALAFIEARYDASGLAHSDTVYAFTYKP